MWRSIYRSVENKKNPMDKLSKQILYCLVFLMSQQKLFSYQMKMYCSVPTEIIFVSNENVLQCPNRTFFRIKWILSCLRTERYCLRIPLWFIRVIDQQLGEVLALCFMMDKDELVNIYIICTINFPVRIFLLWSLKIFQWGIILAILCNVSLSVCFQLCKYCQTVWSCLSVYCQLLIMFPVCCQLIFSLMSRTQGVVLSYTSVFPVSYIILPDCIQFVASNVKVLSHVILVYFQ
jgi:hypothetical protein